MGRTKADLACHCRFLMTQKRADYHVPGSKHSRPWMIRGHMDAGIISKAL